MEHGYASVYGDVILRPLYKTDIEKLRVWRNDPGNTKYLRNIGEISSAQQEKWYEGYLNDDTECIFAIVENSVVKDVVGSVSLYDIQDGVAEVGKILIGDERAHGKGIGRKALVMAMATGFEKMGLKTIVGAVSPDNVQAYTNDMRVGFKITGEHILANGILEKEIAITYDELKTANEYVNDICFCNNGMKFFVGQYGEFAKQITEEDVNVFAEVTGDKNPVHIDDEYASESQFGCRICHGFLTGSLISACIGTVFPGEGTIYLEQNMKFIKPVKVGEVCTARVTVRFINADKKILTLDTVVTDSFDTVVICGEAKVMVKAI